MSAQSFEKVLARLYTDASFRNQFLQEPEWVLQAQDLTPSERSELMAIDRCGLVMASHSFSKKLEMRKVRRHRVLRPLTAMGIWIWVKIRQFFECPTLI